METGSTHIDFKVRTEVITTSVYNRLRRYSAVRSVIVSLYPLYANAYRFFPGPAILVNTIPKAGTHLATSLIDQLPKTMRSGVHVTSTDFSVDLMTTNERARVTPNVEYLRGRLSKVRNGHYASAHLQAVPEVVRLVEELKLASIFVYRDPRDIIVSDLFFMERQPVELHEGYHTIYNTMEEKLSALISGFSFSEYGRGAEPVRGIDQFMGWLDHDGTLAVRFEDLVGASGGGSNQAQLNTVRKIATHVNRELRPGDEQWIADRIWSSSSGTFRQGRAGGWRDHFTRKQKELFKETAGDQLIVLGYEDDFDW